MSNTSTSTPFSIAGVGRRVLPYRLYTGRPVTGSRSDPTLAPAWCAPRMPCSGPNNATRCTPGVCASRSTSLTSSRSTPVGLVIRPTCLPRIRSSRSCSRTSMPVWNAAVECSFVAAGTAADEAKHANKASSATIALHAPWRSIITLLPLVVGDLRLRRLPAGMDLKIVHVPATTIDLLVGPVAELDVTRVRRQAHRLGLPPIAGTRQQTECLPVDAIRRCLDAAVIIAVLQAIPGLERQRGAGLLFDRCCQCAVQVVAIARKPCFATLGWDNGDCIRDTGIDVMQRGDG